MCSSMVEHSAFNRMAAGSSPVTPNGSSGQLRINYPLERPLVSRRPIGGMVDAVDSKSIPFGGAGSSPASGRRNQGPLSLFPTP